MTAPRVQLHATELGTLQARNIYRRLWECHIGDCYGTQTSAVDRSARWLPNVLFTQCTLGLSQQLGALRLEGNQEVAGFRGIGPRLRA
jgi:hypothetical protein